MAIYRRNVRKRKAIKRRAKGTQAKWKRAKMARTGRSQPPPRMQVGFTPGRGNAKSAITSRTDDYSLITDVAFDSDSPNQHLISTIDKGTAINERERDIAHVYGFRIQMIIGNLQDSQNLCFHYAVISPKGHSVPEAPDFFRGYDGDRGLNFTAGLSGLDILKSPINVDRYTVFFHKRVWLRSQKNESTGTYDIFNSTADRGLKTIEHYVNLNRQLRYNDEGVCETPLYLVYWAGYPFKAESTAAAGNAYLCTHKVTCNFKDPK